MKMLKVFDRKDYTDDMPVFEKHSVRAVIIRNGRIAMQQNKDGMYKILGGGVEKGEQFHEALAREVAEESGLIVKQETIREIGQMLEKRRDCFEAEKIYVCHSYFYACDVWDEVGATAMTESEIAMGFHLVWATPQEIIEGNADLLMYPWIDRDTQMIRMISEGSIENIRL